MNLRPIKALFSTLSIVLILQSCSPFFYQPFGDRSATLGPETPMKGEFKVLPQPEEPIVAAVYKFRDQTGQYKESNIGASWSTAVTQGATNILIRALEESGWFIPIERENISNLINERKIISSSRAQYEQNSNVVLPPLLFAGVLLEGGIVSYETNVYTGGAGVRYFGADASAQYREDRVSIYLRAISTSNGKILKSVYTTKSILSQEVTSGFFRFVKFRRLLEAETGFTYNEPREMAINEAVEKAVHSLIIEGLLENLWASSDTLSLDHPAVQDYLLEKASNVQTDYIGRLHENNYRSSFYLGVNGSGQGYFGDFSTSFMQPGYSVNVGVGVARSIFIEGNVGNHQIHIRELFNTTETFADVGVLYLANPNSKFSPLLKLGAGTYFDPQSQIGLSQRMFMPYVSYSGGLEYLLSDNIGLVGKAFLNQLLSDRFDGVEMGRYNDYIWGVNVGLKFYIGKNKVR
jgi:curli production assembly/transport component CsgG